MMMLGMRGRFSMLLVLVITGCAGVSPRPHDVSVDSLPIRERSPEEDQRLAELVDECVREVVLRHYEAAERSARSAIVLDPRCARARAVLGIVLLQRANEQEPPDLFVANQGEAETVLAERLAPEDPFVAWVRALFLGESGHLSAAAAVAEAALARSTGAPPEERAPLFGLAGTYRYELGEERAALPLLQAYVGLRPDDAAASFRIGSCLLRMSLLPTGAPETRPYLKAQRHAEQAARAFQRCVQLAPGDEDAALAVGAATLRASELAGKRGEPDLQEERLAEASAHFASTAERFLDNAEALFRVGVIEETRGRVAEARASYEAALARDDKHLGSVLNLASLRQASGDEAAAAELLRRALAIDAEKGGLLDKERQQIEAHLGKGR